MIEAVVLPSRSDSITKESQPPPPCPFREAEDGGGRGAKAVKAAQPGHSWVKELLVNKKSFVFSVDVVLFVVSLQAWTLSLAFVDRWGCQSHWRLCPTVRLLPACCCVGWGGWMLAQSKVVVVGGCVG